MNTMQHEPLFTDLTSNQAETTSGGIPFDDGGLSLPAPSVPISVGAFYGNATASVQRKGLSSFRVNDLFVKDGLSDGHPVYALFQGQTSDGSGILSTRTKRFDLKGFRGKGTSYPTLNGSFSKSISKFRVVIMRDNPGKDLFVAGQWVPFL